MMPGYPASARWNASLDRLARAARLCVVVGLTAFTGPLVGAQDSGLDSDLDGLSDDHETTYYGTHPSISDSDGDGLSDGDEVTHYGTNPLSVDTDGDGYSDGWEVTYGYNPLPPEPTGGDEGGGGGGGGPDVPEFIPDHACIVEPDDCSQLPKMKEENEENN